MGARNIRSCTAALHSRLASLVNHAFDTGCCFPAQVMRARLRRLPMLLQPNAVQRLPQWPRAHQKSLHT